MSMSPEKADRMTMLATLGALGAIALSVGALLLPRPDVTVEATPVTAPVQQGGATPSVGQDEINQTVVWADLSAVMNQVHEVEQVAIDDSGQQEEVTIEPGFEERPEQGTGENAPRGVPGWRYVGSLETGGALTAVVMVESKQHFASPGARVAGYEVDEITEEYIVVSTDTGERRVDRESAPTATLTGATRGAINTPRRRPGDPAQGETPEERLERLRGGGR